jgi:hypothetical protein
MGSGSVAPQYNTFHKEELGWLNANGNPPIQVISTSGTYSLEPYETKTNNPKALKVLKSNNSDGTQTFYYIEYRQPIGDDKGITRTGSGFNLFNSVVLHVGTPGNTNSSYVLDLSGQSNIFAGGLAPGKVFTDPLTPNGELQIQLLSANSTAAQVQITFTPVTPGTCHLAAPTITVSPQTNTVMAGNPANYELSVTDNDQAGCAPATYALQVTNSALIGTFAENTLTLNAQTTKSTLLTLTPAITLTAGSYSFTTTATNLANAAYLGTTSNTLVVTSNPQKLNIKLSTDQSTYTRTEGKTINVEITVMVGIEGVKISGAQVALSLILPDGTIVPETTKTTSSDGQLTYKYALTSKSFAGQYSVKTSVTYQSVTKNLQLKFNVL